MFGGRIQQVLPSTATKTTINIPPIIIARHCFEQQFQPSSLDAPSRTKNIFHRIPSIGLTCATSLKPQCKGSILQLDICTHAP